jgi:hypothetical protein
MRRRAAGAVILAVSIVATAVAAPPRCMQRYNIEFNELDGPVRSRIVRPYEAYGPAARQGYRLFLEYRVHWQTGVADGPARLAAVLERFRYGPGLVAMKFPNDEALFAAIARIHNRTPQGIPRYGWVFGELGNIGTVGNPGLAQGAAFEIYVVDKLDVGVGAFRRDTSGGGFDYRWDFEDAAGLRHEVKGLFEEYAIQPGEISAPPVQGDLFHYDDVRLKALAEETTRIIIMEAPTEYASVRIDFAAELIRQRGDIESVLLKQFETPRVQAAFLPAVLVQRRIQFQSRLAQMLTFHQ